MPELVLDNLPSPRIFKSHLTLDMLPENLDTKAKVLYLYLIFLLLQNLMFLSLKKIVYCARNPKDVAVSAYNFFKSIIEDEITGTFDEYVESFLEGKGII